jgi:hypothetical protein
VKNLILSTLIAISFLFVPVISQAQDSQSKGLVDGHFTLNVPPRVLTEHEKNLWIFNMVIWTGAKKGYQNCKNSYVRCKGGIVIFADNGGVYYMSNKKMRAAASGLGHLINFNQLHSLYLKGKEKAINENVGYLHKGMLYEKGTSNNINPVTKRLN